MPLSEEQKALRRTGIGSSDVAALVGVSPFRTAFDVYLDKVEGFESEPTEWQEIGDVLEPAILTLHQRRTKPDRVEQPGTLIHPKHRWALDTPDAVAYYGREVRPIEAKAPRVRTDEYGDEGSDVIAEGYLCQAQWHIGMQRALGFDAQRCDVPVLFAGSSFQIFHVEWDEELYAMLFDSAARFIRDHLEARVPPSMHDSRHAEAWLKERFRQHRPELLQGDEADEERAAQLRIAHREHRIAEAAYTNLKNEWKQRIADAAGVATSLGGITWQADKRGIRTFRVPKAWERNDGIE